MNPSLPLQVATATPPALHVSSAFSGSTTFAPTHPAARASSVLLAAAACTPAQSTTDVPSAPASSSAQLQAPEWHRLCQVCALDTPAIGWSAVSCLGSRVKSHSTDGCVDDPRPEAAPTGAVLACSPARHACLPTDDPRPLARCVAAITTSPGSVQCPARSVHARTCRASERRRPCPTWYTWSTAPHAAAPDPPTSLPCFFSHQSSSSTYHTSPRPTRPHCPCAQVA